MYIPTQRLAHLPTPHIRDRMQRQTIEQLIMIEQILAYTVHNQMQQLMLFMQKQRHSQVPNLLLGVLIRRDQIDRLEMAEIDIPAQDVDIQQLADVFLPVVAIEIALLELLPDVRQLLVDPLLFELSRARVP